MILAVNIGNSTINLGGFQGEQLCFRFSVSTRPKATAFEYAGSFAQGVSFCGKPVGECSGAVIASVVPILTGEVKKAVELAFGCEALVVSPGVKTGLNIKVNNALNLGTDLVCAAVAASRLYPHPCVIFSLGTATTLTALDATGSLLGTSIMAGVQISLEALREHAACLPQISLQAPSSLIGIHTVDSMKSGLIYGTASMLDGMGKRYAEQLGEDTVFIATGRYASEIIPYCESSFILDEDLLLKGLNLIYHKNVKA